MKVLVTGATGFIGSHICQKLKSEGHEVYGLTSNKKKIEKLKLGIEYIHGEITSSEELKWLRDLPSDIKMVVHAAGLLTSQNVFKLEYVNYLCTKNLFEQLAKRYTKLHFTYISSISANVPVSAYGRSKKQAEDYIVSSTSKDWSYTIVRAPLVFGPRDRSNLSLFKMVKKNYFVLPGLNSNTNQYSYIYIDDLVSIIINSSALKNNELYNASVTKSATLDEIVSVIKDCMEVEKLRYISIPLWLIRIYAGVLGTFPTEFALSRDRVNELSQKNWTCENKKLLTVLPAPTTELKETIKTTYEYYLTKKWL